MKTNIQLQPTVAWKIVMPILDEWSDKPPLDFQNYSSSSWGPEAANLLFNSGHHWPMPTELSQKNGEK